MATPSRQQLKDFSLDLIPSHQVGLALLVDRFQVDALRSTRETYESEPYLKDKLRNEDGWLDAWPGYVSGRLLTVRPGPGMDEHQALAGIKALEEKLRQLANQPQPCIDFTGSLEIGEEAGWSIWKISSRPSPNVKKMREQMRESCERMGFHVLPNREPIGVLHIVVRNRWKNSGIEPREPTARSMLRIVFDKLGFTRRDLPVAGQKYFREPCGQTLCMNFGTAHIHGRPSTRSQITTTWAVQGVTSVSSDISMWPPLASTTTRPPTNSSTQMEVIMHALRHPDPPTPVDPIADRHMVDVLQSTGCGHDGHTLDQLSEASFNHNQMEQLPSSPQDGASQMSRWSAHSCTSDCSWISGSSDGPRCFLPQTLFKMYGPGNPEESFLSAFELAVGAHVESAEGTCLEVVSVKYEMARELVELIAGTELLLVSPTHRIVIGETGSTKQAKDLELGCQVMCASGAKPLRQFRKFQEPDGQCVIMIRFLPDKPVCAFMKPDPILTMGQRQPIRRGGTRRRWGSHNNSDTASLPDTEWSFPQHLSGLPAVDGDDEARG